MNIATKQYWYIVHEKALTAIKRLLDSPHTKNKQKHRDIFYMLHNFHINFLFVTNIKWQIKYQINFMCYKESFVCLASIIILLSIVSVCVCDKSTINNLYMNLYLAHLWWLTVIVFNSVYHFQSYIQNI